MDKERKLWEQKSAEYHNRILARLKCDEHVFLQGQRVLTLCSRKDLEHVFIVPTTSAAFHGHAVFVGMLFQQRQRKAVQPCEVLSKMHIADARLILAIRHIKAPMTTVLDPPVTANRMGKLP